MSGRASFASRPHGLRRLRRWRRLTTGDLAEALGLDLRTYERLEAGTIGLSVSRLLDVADICDGDALGLLASLAWDIPELATLTASSKIVSGLAKRLGDLEPGDRARLQAASGDAVDALLDAWIRLLAAELNG